MSSMPESMAADWDPILDELEKRFENTYKKPFVISESDDLFAMIQQLVPWDIARIQAAWTPGARRFPTDVPFTHRGCAYRTTSGEFGVEHEDLTSVSFPKQRFSQSMRLAIFFFGNAPDSHPDFPTAPMPDGEAAGTTSTTKVQNVTTDIHFEGGPPMSREMRTSIARLHCNLGHPPKAEIVRLLAAAGKLDNKILAALDALRCGTCKRLSKPVKPPTSATTTAMKYAGAFGEHLQADMHTRFWVYAACQPTTMQPKR
jgi:hypothetical protein